MPYEARIRAARELLTSLVDVVQGKVPKAPAAPPKPAPPAPSSKAGAAAQRKSVFRAPSVPPAPKGASNKPIPLPGRWKR